MTDNADRVHAVTVDQNTREARLKVEIDQLVRSWSDPALTQSLSTFQSFCQQLGLSEFPDYFISRNAAQIEDWSQVPLNNEGLVLRDRISSAAEVF